MFYDHSLVLPIVYMILIYVTRTNIFTAALPCVGFIMYVIACVYMYT